MSKIPSKTALVGTHAMNMRYCMDHQINPRDPDYVLVSTGKALRGHGCFLNVIETGPMNWIEQEAILNEIEANNARYR